MNGVSLSPQKPHPFITSHYLMSGTAPMVPLTSASSASLDTAIADSIQLNRHAGFSPHVRFASTVAVKNVNSPIYQPLQKLINQHYPKRTNQPLQILWVSPEGSIDMTGGLGEVTKTPPPTWW